MSTVRAGRARFGVAKSSIVELRASTFCEPRIGDGATDVRQKPDEKDSRGVGTASEAT
jgi:hypothetical protein